MTAFMTHPSVRIKGTENNFEPVFCTHPKCGDRPPHMHCPFCVKSDTYPDPVILKAHYRVKHVDKGLDFAGLKVLRCCDHCDIVGTIKGEKKFKGPHWHCYKCRNGFNRRDEAIKHYRTHFRNPQTTFQIQVAQEVNVMLNNMNNSEGQEAVENIENHQSSHDFKFSMHAPLTEAITHNHDGGDSGYYPPDCYNSYKNGDGTVAVAANETVDASETRTIMIIQDEHGRDIDYKDTSLLQSPPASYDELLQQKCHLERHADQMADRLKEMEHLQTENQQLKEQNGQLMQKIEAMHEELKEYTAGANLRQSEKNEKLIDELQNKHRELLYAQLVRLRMEFNTQLTEPSDSCNTTVDTESSEPNPIKRQRVS